MQLLINLVIGVTDQRGKAFFTARRFDAAEDVNGIGVGDIGDDEANQTGAPPLEAARHQAGTVVEIGNGLFDSCQQRIGKQVFLAVEVA